jgi:hypothetical protein
MGKINYHVDLSDGQGFFSGYALNLSRFGLYLQDISKKIDHSAPLTVVISCEGQNFKMFTRARWTEERKYMKDIGVEIINAPWGWTEFVMAREPDQDTSWTELHQ